MTTPYIGAPIRRKEDRRFLTGQGQFVDDFKLPNALHAAIVRSPHAHAHILSIDTGTALEMAGVVDVLTFEDIAAGDAAGETGLRRTGAATGRDPDGLPPANGSRHT